MEILAVLVEQRGQLVSREHIVERIWGKDVFLDTDNSINGAIRKVRQALRDNPEEPRFIQTVTGRGYRFIAPISDPTRKDLCLFQSRSLRFRLNSSFSLRFNLSPRFSPRLSLSHLPSSQPALGGGLCL